MKTEINLDDDVLDSRDIIERIEELEAEWEDLVVTIKEAQEELAEAQEAQKAQKVLEAQEDLARAQEALEEWVNDNQTELDHWKELADQCEGYGDWQHGETLIERSHWEDYCKELAEAIGAIPEDVAWPCTCIDWEQASRELEVDYMSVEVGGYEYLMRS